MKCIYCNLQYSCSLFAGDSECTHPIFADKNKKARKRKTQTINGISWRKCKAGYKFPSDAIVVPQDERTTDTDPRLVRCAVWDSIYILVSDLKKLPIEE